MKRIYAVLFATLLFVSPASAKPINPLYFSLAGHAGTTALSLAINDAKKQYWVHGIALALSGGLATIFQHKYVTYRRLAKALCADPDERTFAQDQLIAAHADISEYGEALDRAEVYKRRMRAVLLFSGGEGLNMLRTYLVKQDNDQEQRVFDSTKKTLEHQIDTTVKAYNTSHEHGPFVSGDHSLYGRPEDKDIDALAQALIKAKEDIHEAGIDGTKRHAYAAGQIAKLMQLKELYKKAAELKQPEQGRGFGFVLPQAVLIGLLSGLSLV